MIAVPGDIYRLIAALIRYKTIPIGENSHVATKIRITDERGGD